MIGLLPKVYSVIGGVSKALCQFWWISYQLSLRDVLLRRRLNRDIKNYFNDKYAHNTNKWKNNEYGVYTFTDA